MVKLFLLPPMGHRSDFFLPLKAELKNYDVILLDYPFDPKCVSLEGLANYFSQKIQQSTSEEIYLGGLSLGATLSFPIKERLGIQVKHIFAMATGGRKVARARKEAIQNASGQFTPNDFVKKSLSFEPEQFATHFEQNQVCAKKYIAKLAQNYENDAQQFALTYQIMQGAIEVNYQDLMQKYQSQTTVIWGKKDKVFSMRHLRKIRELMPQAKVELLENCGHYLPLESPEQVAKILDNYEISTL